MRATTRSVSCRRGSSRTRGGASASSRPRIPGCVSASGWWLAGDITRDGLGIEGDDDLRAGVGEIYHLAAVYDLSVARDVGMRVNVEGARLVLRFAERCAGLARLQYVSTCYVSGRHRGTFHERHRVQRGPARLRGRRHRASRRDRRLARAHVPARGPGAAHRRRVPRDGRARPGSGCRGCRSPRSARWTSRAGVARGGPIDSRVIVRRRSPTAAAPRGSTRRRGPWRHR
jgi:hypothetical protein